MSISLLLRIPQDQCFCNVHTGAFVLGSNRLKTIDPYHVVIGAIESIDMFVFTSKNVFVPEASLDVPMLENYVGYVAQNAAQGTGFGQVRNTNASFQAAVSLWTNCALDQTLPYRTERTQVHVWIL